MKKILTLILALVMILGMFAGCEKKEEELVQPEGVKLWYGYNTENFMQDNVYPEKMDNRDYKLRMFGIRGDIESVQLQITPDHNIKEYEFELESLKTENGDEIKGKNIEVFSQWYVNVEASYNTSAGYGYYPDALVPMDKMTKEGYNTIEAGMNQGIWINVTIPEKTAAGFYTGTGILTLDAKTYEIPVELTVYDATMPEEVHPRSCFLIWYDYLEKGEGYINETIAKAYFDMLVDKRCMPMYPHPAIQADRDRFVQWAVDNVMDNPKVSAYALPYSVETNENGKRIVSRDSVMELLTKMAVKTLLLRENGDTDANLFDKAYYYLGSIIDEPTGEALERVGVCDLIISECKFAVANEYFKDYPDLYNSLAGLAHVVTTAYNEDLLGSDTEGGVQAWCPQFQHWHTQEQRDQYMARKNTPDRLMGEETWWYGCNNPTAPFPTYHLDDDLIGSRVLSWMQFEYNSDGNLYWCVNNSKEDMWENASDIGGAVSEGNLTYPASKFNLKEPISTMRLESIREGQEDYEYFWMIEQVILKHNEENGTDYDPEALMAPLYDGLYDGMIPVRDNAEYFHTQRIAVLEVLQAITHDFDSGLNILQSKD